MKSRTTGFTFVEMLVVAVLGMIVLLAVMQVLITNQRTVTTQNAVIAGQQSTRMSLDLLFNELREVSPAGGDILGMSADTLRVRLMRKFSYVCDFDLSVPTFTVVNFSGRRFATGDSVFVFANNDEGDDSDDAWIAARVTNVNTGSACPQNGASASVLRFSGQAPLFAADSVGLGAPVRSYDRFTFLTTTLLGDTYIGRREPNGTVTPVSGPVRPTSGLTFEYRDATGAVTGTPASVRQIVVTVRTGGVVRTASNETVSDSITALIHTRN